MIFDILEWTGVSIALYGALLVALQNRFGFWLGLISDLMLIPVSLHYKAYGLLSSYIVYGIISVIGIRKAYMR